MKLFGFLLFFAAFLHCGFSQDAAQDVSDTPDKKIVKKYNSWTVLTTKLNNKKVCYSVLYLQSRIGNKKDYTKKPYIMIHYFNENKKRVAVYTDYAILKGSEVNLSVDGKQFALTQYDKFAISNNFNTDEAIIEALKTSSKLLVRSEGINNIYTIDEYNIKGFSEVFKYFTSKCN